MTQVAPGLWQFTARHPEWSEDEGGEDGWAPDVNWWAYATGDGLLLIDPLIEDWPALERLVADHGSCAAIVRTCHWHQRSIPEAATRFGAPVCAARSTRGGRLEPCDRELLDADLVAGGATVAIMERDDELALWLPGASALVFGDAMLRSDSGELRVCPPSWTQPPFGRDALLARLRRLIDLDPQHILVSHSGLVFGGGTAALRQAVQDG
jgi:glyoxylase-like metal-dependent hydrolase (beta-lactamase superfamily II)